ncbi:MAG: 2-oxoacid:acceptor oxidoreductase, partial [Thermoprotei archaeon]
IGLDALLRAMEDFFRGKLLETNREAAKRAYELVREVRGDG